MRVFKTLSVGSKPYVLTVAFLAASATPVIAGGPSKIYVAGDSIGVGIAKAAHLPSVARTSASASALGSQLRGVPVGSTVIISIGTNDAVAGRTNARLPNRPDLNLVYVGPPCVKTKWNGTQLRFATFLARNTRHIALPCLASARAKDGVHFTGAGYARLWATIRHKL
jgi:lysophospholipase L1-like esterase